MILQSLLGSCLPRSAPLLVCLHVCSVALSCPTLCDPMDYSLPGSSVHEISRQGYWSGLLFPSPGDLPDPGIKPMSPALPADSLLLSHQGSHSSWANTFCFGGQGAQRAGACPGAACPGTSLGKRHTHTQWRPELSQSSPNTPSLGASNWVGQVHLSPDKLCLAT